MKSARLLALTLLWTLSSSLAWAEENPQLLMKTTAGEIKIELFAKEAPITTANFLEYAKSGFFDGTIFHRVMSDFVIQGGGFTKDMKKKKTRDPIKNEANNGLKNSKYTLSMARLGDPHSATSQFFINVKDNPNLDPEFQFGDGVGYAVFGKVIDGQKVVDKIKEAATETVRVSGRRYENVPVKPIVIEKVELLKPKS